MNFSLRRRTNPPNKVKLARFYSLMKIHKTPVKICPIIQRCDSPTENICKFVDSPLCIAYHLLSKTPTNNLKCLTVLVESWLGIVDVKYLYAATIPQKDGLDVCRNPFLATENDPDQMPIENGK